MQLPATREDTERITDVQLPSLRKRGRPKKNKDAGDDGANDNDNDNNGGDKGLQLSNLIDC
jgi:hypothetical protein